MKTKVNLFGTIAVLIFLLLISMCFVGAYLSISTTGTFNTVFIIGKIINSLFVLLWVIELKNKYK